PAERHRLGLEPEDDVLVGLETQPVGLRLRDGSLCRVGAADRDPILNEITVDAPSPRARPLASQRSEEGAGDSRYDAAIGMCAITDIRHPRELPIRWTGVILATY